MCIRDRACALTGKQTCDISVHRLLLGPLSHTRQGTKLLIVFLFAIEEGLGAW